MSQENVEVLRAAYEAVNRGDMDALLKDWASDCEVDASRAIGPVHGTYHGRDQVRRAFEEFFEPWESCRVELDELIDAGEDVVAVGAGYFRGRDGIEVQTRTAWVWTVRDGTITRMCFYPERQEALEAIGLSNAQITKRAYELFNRRDIDGFLELCHADIEWQDEGTFDTTPVVGVDAVRAYLDTVLEPWEAFRKDPEEIIDLGHDRVLGLFRATARGRGSGVEVEVQGGDLVTFREGKVGRYTAYPREQALQVAGLSE